MLIRITQKCRMGCNHCLVDATEDGEHMETKVFISALRFCVELGDPLILISGGEPTEHPSLFEFLQAAREQAALLSVLSNGMFFNEWDRDKVEDLLDLVDSVQVTNDPRYYPIKVEPYKHDKVMFEDHLRVLSPHGRAVTNKIACDRTAPECFNLRSLVRAGYSLPDAMAKLYTLNRFCTPSINIDGSIVVGESTSCKAVGWVDEHPRVISRRLAEITCERCGLVRNLGPDLKRAIGESRIITL